MTTAINYNKNSDEQAINGLLERLSKTFSSLSAMTDDEIKSAYREMYTEDCDYVLFDGTRLKGVEANAETHIQLGRMWIFKGAALEGISSEITFLSDTVAIAHTTGAIRFRWQKKVPKGRLSVQTTVFIKQNGMWKIRAFQNTRIQPPTIFQKLFSSKK